jgi:Ca-activated chloride channel family protein
MSFAVPLWLLALALIPLALLGQRELRRRRATPYTVRFTAVGVVNEALAAEPGWRRRLPALATVLTLAALATGVVALARPRISHRVPIGDASLMLVLDHSGSMASGDVQPSRLHAAERAANTFIDQLPSSIRLGVVTFSSTPDTAQQPLGNHAAARGIIDNQVPNGGTDTGPALALALSLLRGGEKHHPPSAIVLLSDGAANLGESPVLVAAQARQDRIPIYTVALGTPDGVLNEGPFGPTVAVPPDPQLMNQIARTSGGRAFDAQTADELNSIYQALGNRLSSVKREQDVTPEVVLAAAMLLLLAIAAAVRTAPRLP